MITETDAIQIQYAINHLQSLLDGLDKEDDFHAPIRIALRGFDELSQEMEEKFPSLFSE